MPHCGTPLLNSAQMLLVHGVVGQSGVGITAKELLPIVNACALYMRFIARFRLGDIAAVVHILDTLTSKAPTIMHLLHCFGPHFDVALLARHI